MDLLHRNLFLSTLVLITAIFSCKQESEREKHILIFSKTVEFRHASIENGREMFLKLEAEKRFKVDTTEDAAFFNDDSLQKYSAIVFLSTTGDILDHAQQAALQRYVQAGGGFLGVHGASGAEYTWPWYGKLLGARFESHPSEIQTGDIYVTEKDHPANRDLPFPWEHTEEWYNFESISPDIKILAKVNESSFQGGKHGDNHPIFWCQEFEGGRSFYTALGHRPEAYRDSTFISHILAGLDYVIGDNSPLDYGKATILPAPEEVQFHRNILLDSSYVEEPMELAVAKDGRIFYIERKGRIRVYNQKTKEVKVVGTIPVYHRYEDGLLGLTLDPDFEDNKWIYVFYSAPNNAFNYHLSRFTLNGEELINFESEKILLKIHEEYSVSNHTGGSLSFGPEGNLFIATGDNTNPFGDSKGYAPIDERPGRIDFDAQRSSGNTKDLRGKILRIHPEKDGSYTIPEGNLFKDSSQGSPEIYVMGTRNSFRISVDPKNSWLYWGDVGPDAGKDSIQGPRGYDEINQAREAGNFGWPYFVGNNLPYAHINFSNGKIGKIFDVQAPINNSPRNTGAKILPPAKGAFIYYPYVRTEQFPLLGQGGRTAMAGPVYHFDPDLKSNIKLPEYYDSSLFIYDWIRNWIMVVRMDNQGNYSAMEPFMPSTDFEKIIDMELGPDGALYILEYGKVWYAPNTNARLSRLEFNETLPEVYSENLEKNKLEKKVIPNNSEQVNINEKSGNFLISKSDCKACHAVDQKLVGPSYIEIAIRYKPEPDIIDMLADKIINGGAGVWGENLMSAHPQHTKEEAKEMVKYILSLKSNLPEIKK
ncbi:ThuA domain-containing protein [Cyclobacterium jeungdonense]|uniref:ThuA domain-containing protein n=1 Tax=Cyclobacterium jeungdonense TaxID=708087 RepID=A0ABT8C8V6_9BACT|nr:ThuA domain-containing protein [Cyclobacterium jeungdonense]MDN3688248.1 ThuA domain-containing protein [Cyclobacterium jeungdonense]